MQAATRFGIHTHNAPGGAVNTGVCEDINFMLWQDVMSCSIKEATTQRTAEKTVVEERIFQGAPESRGPTLRNP